MLSVVTTGRFLSCNLFRNAFNYYNRFNVSVKNNSSKINARYFKTVRSGNDYKQSFSRSNSSTGSGVTVFTYSSDNFYRILSVFGLLQAVFWVNLSSLSLIDVKVDRSAPFLSEFQQKHKHKLAAGSLLLGGLVLFFSLFYPLRSVKKIILLKNNKEIQLSTYSFFGRTRDLRINLDDVSCKQSRNAKGSHLPMKIRGKMFYFLLDKKSGTFHDPQTFDQVVGLNRSLL